MRDAVILALLLASPLVIISYFRARRPEGASGVRTAAIRWSVLESVLLIVLYFFLMGLFASAAAALQLAGLDRLESELVEPGSPFEAWRDLRLLPRAPVAPFLQQLGVILAVPLALLAVWRVALRGTGSPRSALGLVRLPPPGEIGRLIALGVALVVPIALATQAWMWLLELFGHELQPQEPVIEYQKALELGDLSTVVMLGLLAVVVAPIVEEVLFRGLLYGALRRRHPRTFANLATSVAFAAIHGNLAALAPIFILGVVLAAVYERRGVLWDAIVIHAVFNSVSLTAMALGWTDP